MLSLSISMGLADMSRLIHIAGLPNFLKPFCAIQRDLHSSLVSVLGSTRRMWHHPLLQARLANKAAYLEDVVHFALLDSSALHFRSRGRCWPALMNFHCPSFGHWSRPSASLWFSLHDRLQIGHLSTDRKNRDRCCSSR
jgi:hypothetical protein